jgi:hypothetical protein
MAFLLFARPPVNSGDRQQDSGERPQPEHRRNKTQGEITRKGDRYAELRNEGEAWQEARWPEARKEVVRATGANN